MDEPVVEVITPDPPVLIPEANALNFPGSEGFLYQAQAVVSHPPPPTLCLPASATSTEALACQIFAAAPPDDLLQL